jgi:hypothetical protein
VKLDNHHVGEIEAGVVTSLEAYVGAAGGSHGVELEEQFTVADSGPDSSPRPLRRAPVS